MDVRFLTAAAGALSLTLSAGCLNNVGYDGDDTGGGGADTAMADTGGGGDTGTLEDTGQTVDTGGGDDTGQMQGALTVTIEKPADTVYTNGAVEVELSVSGEPDTVELLVDGAVVATPGPPYSHTWKTGDVDEGMHTLKARATRGAGTEVSDPVTVHVDRTAPTVAERSPAQGATNVWVHAPITMTFSEPIDAMATTSGFRLKEDQKVHSKTAEWSEDRTSLTIDAGVVEQTPTGVELVPPELSDRAGNVAEDLGWSWTVSEWYYPGGQNPAADGLQGLAVDDGDGIFVVSRKDAGSGNHDVQVRRWDGSGWNDLGAPLDTDPAHDVLSMDVIWTKSTGPVVAWTEDADGNRGWEAAHVKRWDGSNWTTMGGRISHSDATDARSISLGRAKDGKPVVVWQEEIDNCSRQTECISDDVRAKKWSGSVWSDMGRRLDAMTDFDAYDPAVTRSGNALAVTFVERENRYDIETVYMAEWQGSAWKGNLVFQIDTSKYDERYYDIVNPSIAVSQNGETAVAFNFSSVNTNLQTNTGAVQVYTAGQTNWAQLSGDFVVSSDSSRYTDSPVVRYSPGGELMLAWVERTEARGKPADPDAFLKKYNPGGSWSFVAGGLFEAKKADDAWSPTFVFDAWDSPVLGWGQDQGGFVKRRNE